MKLPRILDEIRSHTHSRNGVPPVPTNLDLDPKTAEIMSSIVATTRERDELRHETQKLRALLSHDRDRLHLLETEAATLRSERDFYLRHSVSLTTNLQSISLLILDAIENAKTAAYTPKLDTRSCTCHPDDNPPSPCPRKFALSECRIAAGQTVDPRSDGAGNLKE